MKILARPRKGEPLSHCKTWRITYEAGLVIDQDGKAQRRQITETFHGTKREAREHAEEQQAKMRRGAMPVKPTRSNVTEYLADWLEEHGATLKPSTRMSYATLVRVHIVPRIGTLRLSEVTPEHLRTMYRELQAGGRADGKGERLSPRRVAYVHAVLRAAFRQAVRGGLLVRSPTDNVKPPKPDPRPVRSYTIDEARRIQAATADHRLAALFVLAWQAGLRLGELLGLHWEDVDLDAGQVRVMRTLARIDGQATDADLQARGIRVVRVFGKARLVEQPTPKTKDGQRTLRLTSETTQALRNHRVRQDAEKERALGAYQDLGYVFADEIGRPISPDRIEDLWPRVQVQAEVPRYPFHSLRHTCATLLLSAGWPLAAIAEQLGHSDFAFTKNVYAHLGSELQARLVTDFDTYLAERAAGSRAPGAQSSMSALEVSPETAALLRVAAEVRGQTVDQLARNLLQVLLSGSGGQAQAPLDGPAHGPELRDRSPVSPIARDAS